MVHFFVHRFVEFLAFIEFRASATEDDEASRSGTLHGRCLPLFGIIKEPSMTDYCAMTTYPISTPPIARGVSH